MRTPMTLPEHLLVEAKHAATERRTSLTRLVEEALRAYLAQLRAEPVPRGRLQPLPINRKSRPVRGVDPTDTSALMDLE